MKFANITFPKYTGVRCLMMPYIQGDPDSVPKEYSAYREIIESLFFKKGDIGFLTIDESIAKKGKPHRGSRSRTNRALHTEVGRIPGRVYCWGGGGWATDHLVTLEGNVEILLANNTDDTCAVWDATHENTSLDGDIGHVSHLYPYDAATMIKAGEVHKIGILTPHESLPVSQDIERQFLRIISSGVHGRASYFTDNPLFN